MEYINFKNYRGMPLFFLYLPDNDGFRVTGASKEIKEGVTILMPQTHRIRGVQVLEVVKINERRAMNGPWDDKGELFFDATCKISELAQYDPNKNKVFADSELFPLE